MSQMADIKSAAERSKNMSAIRSKNTKPEVYIRKRLYSSGFRYRIGSKSVPGHPDIYIPKYRVAIFIHGCFWHRHANCKYAYFPKSRIEFWSKKFSDNMRRDQVVQEQLRDGNIRQLIIWECAIREAQKKSNTDIPLFDAITDYILSDRVFEEISSSLYQKSEVAQNGMETR